MLAADLHNRASLSDRYAPLLLAGGDGTLMAWDLGLASYDGWMLPTSAATLPALLVLCPPGVRVAAWQYGALAPIIIRPSPGEVTAPVYLVALGVHPVGSAWLTLTGSRLYC